MHIKSLFAMASALSSIGVFAAPVAPASEVATRGNPTEFRGSQYRPLYREAEALVEAEGKEKEKRQNPTEFRFAGYARLYKEASDANLAEAQK